MNLDDWEAPTTCSIIKHRPTGIDFYLLWDAEAGKEITAVCPRATKYPPDYVARLKIEANEAYDAFDSLANG
jgi:hypothetical protein